MSLDPEQGLKRPARRRGYIAQLLEPLEELTPEARTRLEGSLTLLFGIDPIVSLRDNSDFEAEGIPELLGWAAQQLVEAALAEARGT
jgi:hypothetical protein